VTALTLGCAYVADLLCGDPEWFPHPVRLIGRLTAGGEALTQPGRGSARRDLIAGAVLVSVILALTVSSTIVMIVTARWLHPSLGFTVDVILAWTALATGSLLAEARQVLRALDADDLVRARQRLARIVGRDTATLPEPEVSRGLIETLAESTCDGIVAPLLYLVMGGVPVALAYKAINTLDSMIGHREPPYTYFGRCAARLDDVANFHSGASCRRGDCDRRCGLEPTHGRPDRCAAAAMAREDPGRERGGGSGSGPRVRSTHSRDDR
jgi:adenosylcobinamide-phosphate synthase